MINSIDNGVNKVSGKEGLKSLSRVLSAGGIVIERSSKRIFSVLLIDIFT